MKRITYRSFCSIALSILCLCVLGAVSVKAYEAVINEVVYNSANHVVSVEGSLGEDFAGKEVTLTIFRPGKSMEDLTVLSAKEMLAFTAQTTANDKGDFEFQAGIEGETGEYTVFMTCKGVQAGSGSFMHISDEDIEKALEELRLAKDTEQMYSKLKDYAVILELDLSEFNTMDSEIQNKILNRLVQNDSFKTAEEFKKLFEAVMISEEFNFAKDEKDIKILIEKYSSEIGISELNIYKVTYAKKLGDALQTAAAKGMLAGQGQTYSELNDIKDSFIRHVVLDSIANASSWIKVNSILAGNGEAMGINISAYERLSDTSGVDKKIAGIRFNTFKELEAAIGKAIGSIQNSGTNGGGGGSGGGSGSGGVSAGSRPASGVIGITPGNVNQEPVKPQSVFDDLDSVPWAVESIEELAEINVINGKEPGRFYPNDNITRAEFVKMLVMAFDLYEDNIKKHFTDIPDGAWYASYASSAWEWGIAEGNAEKEFCGEDNITRQDMAVMIFRAWSIFDDQVNKQNGETEFADNAEISEYAARAVSVMADKGIINGTGDNMFSPKDNATRAAAAKMIYMTMRCIQEGDTADEI